MSVAPATIRGRSAGVLFVGLTLLAWASVPLFLRYFAAYIDGWTANGWRYGISAVFWAPVVVHGAWKGTLPPGIWKAALVPSLFNCLGQSCFAWAPYFIDPGLLTFLLRFHIVFVTMGAYVLFPSERAVLRVPWFWVGLVVVFGGGVGVLTLGRQWPHGATAFGAGLGLVSGLLFAGYALSVRYFMHAIHPVTAFAAISGYTAAGLVAAMIPLGDGHGWQVWSLTGGQWATLVASAFIGIAFAHALYYAGILRLGLALSSGIILLQPVLTSVASYFLFDEVLSPGQWLCGLVALAGAGVLLAAQHRASKADQPERQRSSRTPAEQDVATL
jgi:drug/metabolite transporter (DMT)-like permease